jgi:hypothetical protein
MGWASGNRMLYGLDIQERAFDPDTKQENKNKKDKLEK